MDNNANKAPKDRDRPDRTADAGKSVAPASPRDADYEVDVSDATVHVDIPSPPSDLNSIDDNSSPSIGPAPVGGTDQNSGEVPQEPDDVPENPGADDLLEKPDEEEAPIAD